MSMSASLQRDLDSWLDDRWAVVCRAVSGGFNQAPQDDGQVQAWRRVLTASDFAFDVLRRQPDLLSPQGWRELHADDSRATDRIEAAMQGVEQEQPFMAALRRVRRREALRLIFRSVNGLDSTEATLHETTAVYVALLRRALAFARVQIETRHGVARAADGTPQHMVVIGMGKVGGGELNFSSDIDLILAYPEGGSSDGARPLDNEDYFVRLGRQLIRLLAEPGADGFVARVDMRLRPFGQSGRLALPFAAMEQYYQREGRDWERYAWIKAAPVAGDPEAGQQLLQMLRPFVYRKYLDYGAFAGLRKLKALIADQVARKDLSDNLKHGPGGIREVEFCVQLIQMIRGGREPALRVRGLLPALAACADRGFMDADSARRLRQAYLFLRAAENAVQMLADQQTHDIPDDARARRRIALSLGFEDWPAMAERLQVQREFVQATFADLLLPHAEGDEPQGDDRDVGLWQAARDNALEAERVADLGFAPGEQGRRALLSVARSAPVRMMSARSAERLDRLMPHLIGAARQTPFPTSSLERLASLVQAVARRSSYLTLLEEQPAARRHLAELFADSAFLAERVIEQPILLDDVLDPRMDQLPLKRHAIAEEISHALDSLDERHSEADLERLNETRASLAFRLGLAFRDGQASAPAIARRLAALAEAVVAEVLELARRELIARHGVLPGSESGDGFAVIAYGSLGGSELGFASDLDLVFLYDESRMGQSSDGERPLEAVRWYQRLAQRVVHWLTSPQRGGRLYEVDTRLRPDGSKGMLVSSLDGFVDYQQNRAWIWEHQALVRARPVAGDAMLMQRFGQWRDVVLARQRDPAQVSLEVSRMRQRWRRERDRSDADRIDLKQGHGALLDLEFLLQILVLSHAHSHPGLLVSGNTGYLIKAVADAGLLSPEQSQLLDQAHGALLSCALRCAMDKRPRVARRDSELQWHLDLIARVADEHGLDPNPPSDP